MTRNTVILLAYLILFSCSKKTEETYSYTFVENAKLTIESTEGNYLKFGRVDEGNDIVFLYEYNAEDKLNTQDDEYSEFIRFQINPIITEFNYSDEELNSINLVFSKSCFCPINDDAIKDVSPKGIISGKKISETEWDITIDVTFYGDEQKNISSIFTLK